MPADPLIILVIGAFAGGIITGLAGFGSGPVVMGLWLLAIEPKIAAPLLMLSALIYLPLSIRTVWQAIAWKRIAPFVVGSAIGVPFGIWQLKTLSPETIKLAIGVFLILYGILRLAIRNPPAIRPNGPLPDAAVGILGGFVGGAAAIPGVIWSLWCGLRGWNKDEQRAIYQPLNLIAVVFILAGLAVSGLVTREVVGYASWCIPAALVGVAIGTALYRHVGEIGFQNIVLLLLSGSGLALILNVMTR
ncbi:MAG: sulfite exporter TauE/SafE family protein, partial [Hyphomicrobiaceae bacterium]